MIDFSKLKRGDQLPVHNPIWIERGYDRWILHHATKKDRRSWFAHAFKSGTVTLGPGVAIRLVSDINVLDPVPCPHFPGEAPQYSAGDQVTARLNPVELQRYLVTADDGERVTVQAVSKDGVLIPDSMLRVPYCALSKVEKIEIRENIIAPSGVRIYCQGDWSE